MFCANHQYGCGWIQTALIKRWYMGGKDGSMVENSQCLLLQRTWVWFPAHTWWFTTTYTSSSRDSNTSLPSWVPGTHMIHRCIGRQNIHAHKNRSNEDDSIQRCDCCHDTLVRYRRDKAENLAAHPLAARSPAMQGVSGVSSASTLHFLSDLHDYLSCCWCPFGFLLGSLAGSPGKR